MRIVRYIGLFVFLFATANRLVAQVDSARHHKKVMRKHKHTAAPHKLTEEEKKKAAIQRTLKEKGFHLPDTAHKK